MAEIEYSTTTRLRIEPIWDFLKDMHNWAPFVMGYQSHEKESEHESLWTLKGDVGALQRLVTFRAHITEWAEPERVAFELEGVNEQLVGSGSFLVAARTDEVPASTTPRPSMRARMAEAVFRLFRRLFRAREGDREPGAVPSEEVTRLTFKLRIEPGGPMAPMINALMQPAMAVAAEDLANRILAHLAAAADLEESAVRSQQRN